MKVAKVDAVSLHNPEHEIKRITEKVWCFVEYLELRWRKDTSFGSFINNGFKLGLVVGAEASVIAKVVMAPIIREFQH